MKSGLLLLAAVASAALAGCGSERSALPFPSAPPQPQVASAAAPAGSVSPDALVGRWGLAAYHRDSDRPRTEAEARRQCNNPYVIAKAQNGVMMHLADETQLSELVVKGGPGGKNYIGPPGPAPALEDREILQISENSMTLRWMNEETLKRYGTMVYVRCGAR
jgi:hypothetical protein